MRIAVLLSFALVAACSSAPDAPNPTTDDEALSGCHGQASSSVPSSGQYYLTTFGGPGEGQKMSCGQSTKNGTWYYAASRQRFGCGAHVRVQANGKCVVVEADDYGPDVCVENRAGKPILDASPLVSKYLFGASSAGWSDRRAITVTKVSSSTPLGPCKAQQSAPPPPDPQPDPDPSAPPDQGPPDQSPPDQGTGAECTIDDDCNGGYAGTELICDQGECVPGCRIDDDCADTTAICIDGQCQ